jgi:tetratricopeptide (TPR) repeat protein
MKNSILILFIVLIGINVKSQETIDYIKLKKDIYGVSCMNVNKTNVDSTLVNLLKIDTTRITKGLEEYYYDLALMYNFKGVYYKEKRISYFTEAIKYNLRCINLNKKNTAAYNNLALLYLDTKQIDKAKEILNLYKKYTRHKYWDKTLIKQIEEAK